ncbi:uncharacterized protein BT62DRAFT_992008 [Guyanagaster necrorhizus]|uniref:F-box domain-containing protein n=1 Tax=Guyanagaster necrorhizus TaxID=856835 RepID=A0A9P7W241_9AGAR|nr:uncharacterized protein BT62DRAFT_992008 [Guyanagaster necrorhizus MCA 3950]KAG7449966.1 hypothetical protein BT62DRAFT_992008 [Guyanagaster necrorhizus MCA 3950]
MKLRRSPSEIMPCTAPANDDTTLSASVISENATSDLENATISTLPVEILTEIFCTACESYDYTKTNVIVPTAIALSNVCSLWRDITIYNSVLWSVLSINLLRVSQNISQANSMLSLYLSRSKNIPLKYIIYSPDVEIVEVAGFFRFVIALMIVGRERCSYAKIRIKQRELAEPFIDRLLLTFRNVAAIDVAPHWLALGPSSASLAHLTITNATTVDIVAFDVIAPSFSITSISFKNCDFVDIMLVLSASCPHLEALTIQDPKCPQPLSGTLLKITSLTVILNKNYLDNLTAILLSLHAPKLVSLTVYVHEWTRMSPRVFSHFFRRSIRLESLTLRNCISLCVNTAIFSLEKLGWFDVQVTFGDLDAVLDAIEAKACAWCPLKAVVLRLVQLEPHNGEVAEIEEDSGAESDPEDEKLYCLGCGTAHDVEMNIGDEEDSDTEDDGDEDLGSDSIEQEPEMMEWRKRRVADIFPRVVPVPVDPDMLKAVNIRYGPQLDKLRAAGMRIAIVSS